MLKYIFYSAFNVQILKLNKKPLAQYSDVSLRNTGIPRSLDIQYLYLLVKVISCKY